MAKESLTPVTDPSEGRRVCLYFGSFNPVHSGHLSLVRYALSQEGVDEVWMVLSPQSPHKAGQEQLPYELRAELIRLSIRSLEGVRLEEIETHLPSPHYTVRSLQALRCMYPGIRFSLLVGEDNLLGLSSWYEYKRLLASTPLFVYPRDARSYTPSLDDLVPSIPANGSSVTYWADAPILDISSTQIRTALREGKRLEGYLASDELWLPLEAWLARQL